MWCVFLLQLYPRRKYDQWCVCFSATHRCESEDRSLKAPSGIRDMSLPWRDLRMWEEKSKIEKSQDCLFKVFQLHTGKLHVSGRILTTSVETWAHQTPGLVCTAVGCSSGFYTQGINMLAGRQMRKYSIRRPLTQHVFQSTILFITTFHGAK